MQYLIGIFIGIALAGFLLAATVGVYQLGRSYGCEHPSVCAEQAP